MKRLLITMAVAAIATTLHAQEFSFKPTGTLSEVRVVIKNLSSELDIKGIEGTEIKIKSSGYEGLPEKAKGLRPLSATGVENTGIGLSVTQTSNEVLISGASREAGEGEYEIMLPKNMKVVLEYMGWDAGDVTLSGLAGEIDAKSQIGDLHFKNVTGPIVATTLSSDIDVVFSSLSQVSASSINSTSGDIDITMPASSKGSFSMGSMSGEVYSDLDFKMESEEDLSRFAGGMNVEATLNGGGVKVSIRTISGDVYIRKSK